MRNCRKRAQDTWKIAKLIELSKRYAFSFSILFLTNFLFEPVNICLLFSKKFSEVLLKDIIFKKKLRYMQRWRICYAVTQCSHMVTSRF